MYGPHQYYHSNAHEPQKIVRMNDDILETIIAKQFKYTYRYSLKKFLLIASLFHLKINFFAEMYWFLQHLLIATSTQMRNLTLFRAIRKHTFSITYRE